jgi:hypothetical protein
VVDIARNATVPKQYRPAVSRKTGEKEPVASTMYPTAVTPTMPAYRLEGGWVHAYSCNFLGQTEV